MLKETIIILLLIALIYYYRQSQTKPNLGKLLGDENTKLFELQELKTKLGSKTLDEILEENEDYETEIDTLTRTKNSLEQDLLAQSNAFQNRLREKDREVKKLKEDLSSEQKRLQKAQENLSSEKQQHKGSLERISLLTQQISSLEKKMPGEFPEGDKVKEHQEQLRAINLLYDPNAKDYKTIDFNGLYEALKGIVERER